MPKQPISTYRVKLGNLHMTFFDSKPSDLTRVYTQAHTLYRYMPDRDISESHTIRRANNLYCRLAMISRSIQNAAMSLLLQFLLSLHFFGLFLWVLYVAVRLYWARHDAAELERLDQALQRMQTHPDAKNKMTIRHTHYVLNDDGNPVPIEDLKAWALWYNSAERTVAFDRIGDVDVSTVFLGFDHSFGGDEGPLLFETMIFDDTQTTVRYGTRTAAIAGHDQLVAHVRDGKAAT